VNRYKRDVFYNVRKLTLEDKVDLLNTAYGIADEWWVDILDCSKSYARQKIEMDFETIMEKFSDSAYFVFIHRRYIDNYLEIGFSAMLTPDYFLWLHLDKKHIAMLVKKFNLKAME